MFPDPSVKLLAQFTNAVEKVTVLEGEIQALSDDALKAKTGVFRARLDQGETLDDIQYEAFAVVREAAKRTIGQRHFDVQLVGGMTLHSGNIAEMRTGEGKTLTSTLALYLNGLSGKGAHLVTVNDYLARRDAVWMGQIFGALGLSVGCIQHDASFLYDPTYKHAEDLASADLNRDQTGSYRVDMDFLRPVSRKEAYAADITYGTNNEFGFDYLRDNMVSSIDQRVQRTLHFAIVDEIDSILIDEARTPLIISAPSDTPSELYHTFARIAAALKENEDYNVDEKLKAATLTEVGMGRVEKALGVENLYTTAGVEYVHHMEEALRAHALFHKDVEYVVQNGEIIIVDEFTGRLMHGRRFSGGLHQAIEAKEGVEVKHESQTMATITFQNLFRLYDKLSGMTGTAETDAEEFLKTYRLDVIVIPTNMPIARQDLPDRVYKTRRGKLAAVVKEVAEAQKRGQPVLVGTISIEDNEIVSGMFTRAGISHEVLNAKNHEREGLIIAQAGRKGSVTIATNMAGRGVDIKLGGAEATRLEYEEVKSLGGLFVMGTERHESRRIDNQLRGRSGRQGDPGRTQFYVSMEDSLMRVFGSDRMKGLMERLGIPDDMPIENKMVSRSIEKAQERVEGHHSDARKHLLSYDDVLNRHREVIYRERRDVLERAREEKTDVLREVMLSHFDEALEEVVMFHTGERVEAPRGLDQGVGDASSKDDALEVLETLNSMVELTEVEKMEVRDLLKEAQKTKVDVANVRSSIIEKLLGIIERKYEELKVSFTDRDELKGIEKAVLLRSIDRLWVDHLDAMTALRQGISMRAYGQRDPLVEYKREAFTLFNRLLASISMETAANFFKLAHRVAEARQAEELAKSVFEKRGLMFSGARKTMGEGAPRATSVSVAAQPSPGVKQEKVGRNEPCPCGSGKKYKKCHGV